MNRLTKGALTGRVTATILASSMFLNMSLPAFAADADATAADSVKTLAPLQADSAGQTDSARQVAEPPKPLLEYAPTGKGDAQATAPDTVPATTADATSSSDQTITPAPPEVTAPQPLASEAPREIAQAQGARPRTPTDPIYNRNQVTGSVRLSRPFTQFPNQQIIHNLIFRDTPAREVIAEIAHRGNINIIIDNSVNGRITGDLHDLTLNEAMDTVLRSTGLEWRQLDSATIIIGMPNALFRLGLNRPMMRVFKINYTSPFEVAQMLWASAFNKGVLSDFLTTARDRTVDVTKTNPINKTLDEQVRSGQSPTPGGGTQVSKTTISNLIQDNSNNEKESGNDASYPTRPDATRLLRGSIRDQVNEGAGFNSAATDPGSETIRSTVAVVTDFQVEQNGGGAIAIPDAKNRQVIVCGTQDDINIAEEVIRLIDRRPRQVHIQSSLVELNNAGIRQLGAAVNLQGAGASGTVLGGTGSPLVQFLPGLGTLGQTLVANTVNNIAAGVTSTMVSPTAGIAPLPMLFQVNTPTYRQTLTQFPGSNAGIDPASGTIQSNGLNPVPGPAGNGFNGFIGSALPVATPSIAGVTALNAAQTAFNFLTLGKRAGGKANISTWPTGLNVALNLVLQTNKAKLLANPSVVVDDNTEALITLANEVVHKVTTTVSLGVVSTNVELVKAGIFLDVIPKVSDDGFVTLRLRPQVSSPLGGPQTFANGSVIVTLLNVREVMAQEVRVKDGQTLVIGGLFSEQEAATMAKVPYLAEAPILGALFRNTIKGRNRTELMLLITPKVVEETPPQAISEGAAPAI